MQASSFLLTPSALLRQGCVSFSHHIAPLIYLPASTRLTPVPTLSSNHSRATCRHESVTAVGGSLSVPAVPRGHRAFFGRFRTAGPGQDREPGAPSPGRSLTASPRQSLQTHATPASASAPASASTSAAGEKGGEMGSVEVGFLGLGIMGTAMARNLLKKGFSVTVWNRTLSKCDVLVGEGAKRASTPGEVVSKCHITIAMLADPQAALDAVFKDGGALSVMGAGKGYVDMSTVDSETSQRIGSAVSAKGGRFLEAPVSGSKKPAEDGTLVILAAGDESLFKEIVPAFDVMGKKSFFLGEVGNGAKMKLVVNMVMGSMVTAFSEGLAVADKAGLSQQTLLDVLDLGALANPMFKGKGPAMIAGSHAPQFPLKHQQKDLRLALALGDELGLPMPVAAAANETFKLAKGLGLGDEDMSAVYKAVTVSRKNGDVGMSNGDV